jgi:dTDP-4-amino-4,6-dideoxygalactose transaminase
MGNGRQIVVHGDQSVQLQGAETELAVDLRGVSPRLSVNPGSIQFVDLKSQHADLRDEILAGWANLLDDAAFIGGKAVSDFESEFAVYSSTRNAVGVANGTDALTLSLRALGVGPGDEVITAANTFFATVEAIAHAGGTPVLADVDPLTGNLDAEAVERAITDRTKVIVPVHLYGQPADMAEITALADAHGLKVLEDNAQAVGASYRGSPTGSLGTIAATSFYPGKNLGACGDAGAVTTDDDDLAGRIRILRDHGQAAKYQHVTIGYNSRLDALQASALSVKLRHIDDWNRRRVELADAYDRHLGSHIETPGRAPDRTHVFHLYVIRHPERDRLRQLIEGAGVPVGMHYPTPIHLTAAFAHLGAGPGSFPHAENWAFNGLSLPMHPHLEERDVESISQVVLDASEELGVFARSIA